MRHFAPHLFKKGQIYHSNSFRGLGTSISMSVGPVSFSKNSKEYLLWISCILFKLLCLHSLFQRPPSTCTLGSALIRESLPHQGPSVVQLCVLPRGLQVEQILSVRRVAIFLIKGVWETHLASCLRLGPLKADCGASSKEPTCQWRKH